MSGCITEGPFNRTTMYGGVPVLNITMIIVFTSIVSRYMNLPNWLFIIPVAFVLYKVFCLNSIFFNQDKTGLVSKGVKFVF